MPPQPPPNPFLSTVLNPDTSPNLGPSTTSSPRSRLPAHARSSFTPAQRSQQARAQPFNASPPLGGERESYEDRQARNEAAAILESTELLIWFSSARNESIAQTRRHYRDVVLGLDDARASGGGWKEEWEMPDGFGSGGRSVEGSPRDARRGSPRDAAKGRERGKKRVVS